MRSFHTSVASLAIVSMLLPSVAGATGVFPDVPDQHPFKDAIETLARQGVIKGNPDGTFRPNDPVSRAAFLTLLYRLSGRSAKAVYGGCFRDIEKGSWYELVVCDAVSRENGFVQGFPDGTFRPGDPVTRTQALKMVFTVLGLTVPTVSSADQDIIKFADLSVSAWYSAYVSGAYKRGILPLPGFGEGGRFNPDQPITRGESAGLLLGGQKPEPSSSASFISSAASSESSGVKNVRSPFRDTDTFTSRQPVAYLFSLTAPKTVVSVTAEITDVAGGAITCRLYLLGTDDFSTEYYLGTQEGSLCRIVATVRPGTYQLQVQPDRAGVAYVVDASTGSTDDNDGFIDAVPLAPTASVAGVLDDKNDLMDWYTFTVPSDRQVTVFASGSAPLTCIVYVPAEVDLFDFQGPSCGVQYRYPAGTYTVGIGRAKGAAMNSRVTYSVQWR